MKKLISLLIVLISFNAGSQTLLVSLGQKEKISSASGSLWVEDKKILKGEAAAGGWQLTGVREGSTYVQAGSKLFRVHVIHPGKRIAWENLNKELKNFIGLQAEVGDGEILIRGRFYRWQDWLNFAEFFKNQNIAYSMEADFSEEIKNKARNYFEEKMLKSGLTPMKINFSHPLQLKLSENQEDFAQYQRILKPFGFSVIKDKTSIEMLPVVKLEMTIVEINKNLKQKFGLSWPENFSAQLYPQFNWNAFSAELDLLEQNGQAKVLASPNLLCRSGQEANFVVGGEFPIKISSRSSKQVVWKNYGISLKFKPRADSSGRMSISLESEVSSIDTSLMVDGVPAIKNHRVSSHFDLVKTELVALSGLIKEEQGRHSEGLPGLAKLPVLGPLFGSQNFLNNKTELVIFVRPSVLKIHEEKSLSAHQHLSP